MAFTGITLFSHILPVIFGFFGVLLIIAGTLDENCLLYTSDAADD